MTESGVITVTRCPLHRECPYCWAFAKERSLKYHGVDPEKFPLYLKELGIWYNHRDRDLFYDIVQVLAGYSQVAYTD